MHSMRPCIKSVVTNEAFSACIILKIAIWASLRCQGLNLHWNEISSEFGMMSAKHEFQFDLKKVSWEITAIFQKISSVSEPGQKNLVYYFAFIMWKQFYLLKIYLYLLSQWYYAFQKYISLTWSHLISKPIFIVSYLSGVAYFQGQYLEV